MDARPNPNPDPLSEMTPLLEVKNLKKHFPIQRGFFSRVVGHVKAVDGVSFYVHSGETLGVVGESGCGKTTTGRMIIRAIDPTAGEIWFTDQEMGRVNVANLQKPDLYRVRRNMQLVFQDPYSSLNPRMTLLQNVGEPLINHRIASGKALEDRVAELLRVVGLRPEYLNRYPYAFSGGQRQRIGIARALALNPQLVILDEPVSALDVSVQAQILNLLQQLQREFGLTYIFIAHDLSVVEHISDRVAVMYVGQLVESARTQELFLSPLHPYTEALLSAVPKPDPRSRGEPIVLEGDVANPANPPSGCYFHPRCRYSDGARCTSETPELREITPGRFARCHYAGELNLVGVSNVTKTLA
jgi:peptide/nickel transport system ATP-binding protein